MTPKTVILYSRKHNASIFEKNKAKKLNPKADIIEISSDRAKEVIKNGDHTIIFCCEEPKKETTKKKVVKKVVKKPAAKKAATKKKAAKKAPTKKKVAKRG